ncbi:endo-1,4-beta-xylanase [Abyssalbus ytuae]|uniref:Beta-xylanase n=1 Tax=Abyssalbus ytuae TaxID=2926907 RepID=A0A9E7D3A0_9FLAO|nr:endo-1,4-beta-xylanase [Abyssalbus ytuae]UOB17619.1 endo-1,4-beta-xylanase [Abyssalbus ytuae]
MKNNRLFFTAALLLLLTGSCKEKPKDQITEDIHPATLQETFKNDFYIGAAINVNQIKETDSLMAGLLKKEFNSITAENMMKSMHIHPAKDSFNFEIPDKFVELGQKNNMYIVGHTLVWHSQLSPWIEKIKDSTEMHHAIQSHINTIVGRYKGKINSWDVVNEALNEDGTLRNSVFLERLGENYLTTAFKLTAEADPDAELYYNDYNMCQPAKRDGAVKLVKKLQENGAKINGVGIQGHWNLNSPSLEEIEKSILAYSQLGVDVAITELDITVLPSPWDLQGADVNQNFEGNPKMNPYPDKLPDSIQDKLAKRYQDIFALFLKHKDKIKRVTFWGVNDAQSWKNDWPIKGRTDFPLLFDRNLKPKEAYKAIISLKEKNKEDSRQ